MERQDVGRMEFVGVTVISMHAGETISAALRCVAVREVVSQVLRCWCAGGRILN